MAERDEGPAPGKEPGSRREEDISALARSDAVQPLETLPPARERLAQQDRAQDIALKRTYARWLLGLMTAQLVIANGVFVAYAWAGRDWDLDAVVIDVWLGTTFAQIVGVVLVVTRYLFPRRDAGSA